MKVAVIGAGRVGATTAYTLAIKGMVSDVVLLDVDAKRAVAEAQDISDALPFNISCRVSAGVYQDITDAKVVIITAGLGQQPGENRLQLLAKNAQIMREIVPQIAKNAKDSIIIVTSNPVDVLTKLTLRITADFGFSANRVFGTGTTLDTSRFRSLLGQYLDINPHHVHGYVLGEHGDSEVLSWSQVRIGGYPLDDYCRNMKIEMNDKIRADVEARVKGAVYRIIEGKGATYYGISGVLFNLVDAIVNDRGSMYTLSVSNAISPSVDKDICIAVPCLLDKDGISKAMPLELSEDENKRFYASVDIIERATLSLK